MKTWRDLHPEWRCVIWAQFPEQIETVGLLAGFQVRPLPALINQWSVDNMEKFVPGRAAVAARSDVIRYEVILEGGVYLDTDVEAFANIESRLEGVTLFVADEWGAAQGHQGNFMFGATRNHPAFYTVVRDLEHHLKNYPKPFEVLQSTGPFYLHRKLSIYRGELVIFPFRLFSPLNYFHDSSQVEIWPAVTLGNHHCDGKWFDRERTAPPAQFLKAGAE